MEKKNNKVLFIADHIDKEGTSKMVTTLVNELYHRDSFAIKLMLFHDVNSALTKNICSPVINLSLKGRIRNSLIYIAKEIIKEKPDVCFVTYTQHMAFMAILGFIFRWMGVKMVYRETIIPSLYRYGSSGIKRKLFGFLYNSYNQIVAQSNDMKDDLVNVWNVDEKRIVVINNLIIPKKRTKTDSIENWILEKKGKLFVAAGRLVHQKGYDILLSRLSEIKDLANLKFAILGEGDLYEDLSNKIQSLGLSNHVKLMGFKTNVEEYLSIADGLILPSRYEGFPNIVLEANIIGIPVFANKCKGGINEIIINGTNGISCNFENPEEFQSGLETFIKTDFDSNTIKRLTIQRYDKDVIMDKYEILLTSLVKN